MGKRAFLIKQEVIGHIFAHRGKDAGAMVRVCGPDLPADAVAIGALFMPPIQAFAIVYESKAWSDLITPGKSQDQVNGVPVLDAGKNIHVFIVSDPALSPGCAIEGVDDPALVAEQQQLLDQLQEQALAQPELPVLDGCEGGRQGSL